MKNIFPPLPTYNEKQTEYDGLYELAVSLFSWQN